MYLAIGFNLLGSIGLGDLFNCSSKIPWTTLSSCISNVLTTEQSGSEFQYIWWVCVLDVIFFFVSHDMFLFYIKVAYYVRGR